jgi:rare lipoprotein A
LRRLFLGACLSLLVTLPPLSADASGHVPAGRGRASWYGVTSTGKQTASGEMYNLSALTAAHKELPFGTVLRVHNLKNGKQVLVRVNDRGPFVGGRIVDLSMRAAEGLRMTASGVAPVALEIVGNPKGEPLNSDSRFYVHIASEPSALKFWRIAGMLGKKVRKPMRALTSYQGDDPVLALCLGPYKNFGQAQKEFLKLEEKEIRALGIIEAPAHGGDIPRREPPPQGSPSASRMPEKERNPS